MWEGRGRCPEGIPGSWGMVLPVRVREPSQRPWEALLIGGVERKNHLMKLELTVQDKELEMLMLMPCSCP